MFIINRKELSMIRIIHTADWHLGQTFYEYDRKTEHIHFLNWLSDLIQSKKADVLLITGDIFDTPNPSAESQRIYYSFLREITSICPNLQIIIIAGNHDSAARLEAPNPLLEEMNVAVRGIVRRNADGYIDHHHLIIPIYKESNVEAYCLAVPYLRQGDYPNSTSYGEGVKALYDELYSEVKEKGKPVIAMGHLQATGAEISENDRSERTVIGGLECVSPEAFDQAIAYTALGHLHRAQRVSGRENIRYAGAPIPMSFAEKNNKQGVILIDCTDESVHCEKVEYQPKVKLMSIPLQAQPLNAVLEAIDLLPEGDITDESSYLEIKVLMDGPEPSYKYQIEEALKGKNVRLARIVATLPVQSEGAFHAMTYEELQTIHPMDIALDVFRRKYGGNEMPDSMQMMLNEVIGGIDV